jgi:hypothetical protein
MNAYRAIATFACLMTAEIALSTLLVSQLIKSLGVQADGHPLADWIRAWGWVLLLVPALWSAVCFSASQARQRPGLIVVSGFLLLGALVLLHALGAISVTSNITTGLSGG